ncbi:hypothetical protein BK816_08145 [Boudabousia tangfeifanii]|uniref:Nudix hydrolase domain-containing protein n=1 Tax=Boudabousia tangfeifanii TaxID=1912795 RepID=A0A1D9MLZ2_9ACTO|nr:NUDIX hydrolase [Boudabousia tangfeifanii]AOZ73258.1 hypothetical protein BK816_08145 [Boudabousia tangfeifanii]
MSSWQTVWKAADFDLEMQRNQQGHHRVLAAKGKPGALAIALWEAQVLLVKQNREAVGEELWELPRGFGDQTDPDACATAVRELVEETGFEPIAGQAELLGELWIDSGLQANAVAVVKVPVQNGQAQHQTDGEVECAKWVPLAEIPRMIAKGQLRDSLTVAAFGLLWSTSWQDEK